MDLVFCVFLVHYSFCPVLFVLTWTSVLVEGLCLSWSFLFLLASYV